MPVVGKMAEEAAPDRVVTHVLDDATPVRVGVRLLQLLNGCIGKAFQQKSFDLVIPFGVHNRFSTAYPKQVRVTQNANAKTRAEPASSRRLDALSLRFTPPSHWVQSARVGSEISLGVVFGARLRHTRAGRLPAELFGFIQLFRRVFGWDNDELHFVLHSQTVELLDLAWSREL